MCRVIKYRILPLLLVGLLSACAQPARVGTMTVQPATINIPNQLKGIVSVESVTGGKDTNPMWTSQVDKGSFKNALEQSLANFGLLSIADKSEVKIRAEIQELTQPLFGTSFSVTSRVDYTVETPTKTRIFNVTEIGTAHMSDAFYGVVRLQLANEKSINNNIKEFINRLTRFLLE